jgi:hypothetical protein
MGRESELQIDKIDKKVNSSHRLRKILAGAVGAATGSVGYIASIPAPHPEFRPLFAVPILLLGLGGAGVTAILKSNEDGLQSSKNKIISMANEIDRQSAIGKVLEENGIIINTSELPDLPWELPLYGEWVKKHPFFSNEKPFIFSSEDKVSKDGAVYKYFMLPRVKEDWGCILRKTDEKVELVAEDHIDTLTESLSQLAQKMGIDLESRGISLN